MHSRDSHQTDHNAGNAEIENVESWDSLDHYYAVDVWIFRITSTSGIRSDILDTGGSQDLPLHVGENPTVIGSQIAFLKIRKDMLLEAVQILHHQLRGGSLAIYQCHSQEGARFGVATRALRAHPPNWIQTNLAPRGQTKPVGLIESVGAPPPSWLRPCLRALSQNVRMTSSELLMAVSADKVNNFVHVTVPKKAVNCN